MQLLSRWLGLALMLGLCFASFSGVEANEKTGYFRIELTDKGPTQFDLNQPEEFLSERALDRREKENVNLDSTDLPVVRSYKDSILEAGVKYRFSSRWFNYLIGGIEDSSVYEEISSREFVEDITLVKPFLDDEGVSPEPRSPKLPLAFKPRNPSDQFGEAFRQIEQINAHYLHENDYKGEGKLIAVLDAGYPGVDHVEAFDHLREEGRIEANFDFIRGEADVYDEHPHGTNVLSIMAGILEGRFKGSGPEASYLLLRSEDDASEFRIEEHSWIAAAEYADSAGADIINSSLGYTQFYDSEMDYSREDLDGETTWVARAAGKAVDKGILVFNSAGNSRRGPWGSIVSPADAKDVVSVGAINSEKELADDSSPGYTADGRVAPKVTAMGEGTAYIRSDGSVSSGNGTSFSSPLLAGAAASFWSHNPELTAVEIREALLTNAHQYDNPDPDKGHGIPDFFRMLRQAKEEEIEGPFEVNKIYPNPFNEEIAVEVYFDHGQELKVELFNQHGGKVLERAIKGPAGSYRELVLRGLDEVTSGVYFLRIVGNNHTTQHKLVKP